MTKQLNFMLNGRKVTAEVRYNETLLEVLRNQFHLYGARESCSLGLCGTCTVMVSGNPTSSCLYPAHMIEGEEVTTIEGLEIEGKLHPVQEAFYEKNAFQCGYCTSGMVLMAIKLLEENSNPSEQEIKDFMSGNICRCASYEQIMESIHEASRLLAEEKQGKALNA